MKRTISKLNGAWALILVGLLLAGEAVADKPSRNDGDHGQQNGRSEKSGKKSGNDGGGYRDDEQRSSRSSQPQRINTGEYFGERHRTVTYEYYGTQFRQGHCPPGLAKKHNGCMPPGQARKWSMGRPLPRDVIFYDVPQALVIQLDRPSAGYRYVRVATDILLIAIGTGMVVDAIQDIGRQ
jgi:Ni/Co efflux regulator RcnB